LLAVTSDEEMRAEVPESETLTLVGGSGTVDHETGVEAWELLPIPRAEMFSTLKE
jgi:hypothetical protein